MAKRDWTKAREKVEREGYCRVCGLGLNGGYIDAAHIVPRSLAGANTEDSIVPLCRECHRAYDALQMDLLPHLTRAEEVEAVRVKGIEGARRRLAPLAYKRERV